MKVNKDNLMALRERAEKVVGLIEQTQEVFRENPREGMIMAIMACIQDAYRVGIKDAAETIDFLDNYRIAYLDSDSVAEAADAEIYDITKHKNCRYYLIEDFVTAFNKEYISDLGLIKLIDKRLLVKG